MYNEIIMKEKFFTGVLMGVLLAAVPGWFQPIFAADSPSEVELLLDPAGGSGELQAVKERIQTLLKHNKELEAEYAALQQEFSRLQKQAQQPRREVKALEKELARMEQERQQRFKEMQAGSSYGSVPSLKQLQLYDLYYQRKELELQIQLKEMAYQDQQKGYDEQMAGWQKELEQNREQERRLIARIDESKREGASTSYEIEFLKQQNALLENQIKALAGSATSLDDNGGELLAGNIRSKEAELAELKRQIEELQTQRSLVQGGESGFSKERLLEEIHRLDQENQQLRNQIFTLRQRMTAQ